MSSDIEKNLRIIINKTYSLIKHSKRLFVHGRGLCVSRLLLYKLSRPPPFLGSSIEGLVAKKEKINQHGERIEQDRSAVAGFKL